MPQPKSGVLLFDGDCPFCRRWARRLRAVVGGLRLTTLPCTPDRFHYHPQLNEETCGRAVQLVLDDGRRYEGAQALARALALRPGLGWVPRLYALPLLRPCADAAYAFVASRRGREGGGCESCG